MRRLGVSVGDRVEVRGGERLRLRPSRVVGNVVMPAGGVDYELGPGKGALVTPDVLASRYPADGVLPVLRHRSRRWAWSHERKAAALEQTFPDTVLVAPLPAELRNLRQVRELPVALAAVVVVLAIGGSGARARRGDAAPTA